MESADKPVHVPIGLKKIITLADAGTEDGVPALRLRSKLESYRRSSQTGPLPRPTGAAKEPGPKAQ